MLFRSRDTAFKCDLLRNGRSEDAVTLWQFRTRLLLRRGFGGFGGGFSLRWLGSLLRRRLGLGLFGGSFCCELVCAGEVVALLCDNGNWSANGDALGSVGGLPHFKLVNTNHTIENTLRTIIFASTPSSWASTSIVALSVS